MQAEMNNRLLVVDDEKDIVQAYKDFLTPTSLAPKKSSRSAAAPPESAAPGYQILTAHSGMDAVAVMLAEFKAGRRIAGAFFDVKMEGAIDGLQAIQEIWKIDPDVHCTVVTAYHDRNVDDIDSLFGPRFKDQWDYLNKPFTQAEIVQKARQMVAAWNRKRSLEQAQAQLVSSERLAAIGQVARGIHHEFGNFLQTIVGQADLALRVKEIEKVHEKLNVIIQAGEKASVIVRNLQSFSKSGAPRAKSDLSKILKDTVQLLNHEFKKKVVEIVDQTTSCSAFMGSSAEIEQVFLNLLINAVHAQANGGKIEIGCKDDGDSVVGWVKDYGTGIPADVLPRIFEYAFTTKGERGSGLGLSICKDIIDSHKGTITVETEAGKGTLFKIRLPRSA